MRLIGIILCIHACVLCANGDGTSLKRKRSAHYQRYKKNIIPHAKRIKFSYERDASVEKMLLHNPENWIRPIQDEIEVMHATSNKLEGLPLYTVTAFVGHIQHKLRAACTAVIRNGCTYPHYNHLMHNIENFKKWLPQIRHAYSSNACYADTTTLSHILQIAASQTSTPAYTLAQSAFITTQFHSQPLQRLQKKYILLKERNEDIAYQYQPYTCDELDNDIQHTRNELYNACIHATHDNEWQRMNAEFDFIRKNQNRLVQLLFYQTDEVNRCQSCMTYQ